MSDSDSPDAGAPIHGQRGDESDIRSFVVNGQAVLFDVDDADRWLTSDTTVPLDDVA